MLHRSGASSPRQVDLIWNITLVCPHDCAECCTVAVHVTRREGQIHLSTTLTEAEQVPYQVGKGTVFEQAMAHRQQQGLELDLAGKLRVLEHLEGVVPRIDFSGGDPLVTAENLQVLRVAAQRFGRQQITLTATGAGLTRCIPEEIAPAIGELNFTYDSSGQESNPNRPPDYAYAQRNLKTATRFALAGVQTRAECPLSAHNISDASLYRLYMHLHDAGIAKLLIMRLFPVGRGTLLASDIPTPNQYRRAIQQLRELEARLGQPQVKLQCALKFFDSQAMRENPCDLLRESLGIMADGTLLTSAWAVGPSGAPLHDSWVLGNVARTPLSELLNSEKAQAYERRLDDNFGHCKIFAFLHSKREDPIDRMFDEADPLYSGVEDQVAAWAPAQ